MNRCPFCKQDPYHYVDIGVGYAPVAITCCDLGIALHLGDKKVEKALRDMRNPSPRAKARVKRFIDKFNEY